MRHTRSKAALLALTLASGWLLSACSSGTQIAAPEGVSRSTGKKNKKKSSRDDADLVTEDELYDENGQLKEGSLGELATSDGGKAINYPLLDLHGSGSLSCDGERYQTIAKYRVDMSAESLNLDFYDGRVVNAGSRVEGEANPKIASKLGVTVYKRPSKEDREKWIKDGFDWAPYAIFAEKVTKQNGGHTWTFSEPLPIFPWPAKSTYYDDLAKQPRTWTASVSGGPDGNFTAKVTMTLVGVSGDEVSLKLTLVIPEDTDRHIYESFPVPKEASYTLNSKTLDVRRVSAVNWYRGDEACDSQPEDIAVDYGLCSKQVPGKDVQTFPCPN